MSCEDNHNHSFLMVKVYILFLLAFLWSALPSSAQVRQLRGSVTDSIGNPLSGVSIQLRNTSTGTRTDERGLFTLQVPHTNATLIVSMVGFETQQINVGDRENVSISMRTGRNALQEVVVTALGIARDKRSLGYATQNIKGEDLVDKGEVNIVSALQGKVAGVDITGASGAVGSSVNINIRGISSFTGSNQPLFVVDGIPISNDVDRTGNTLFDQQPANRALDLNLNDIESVNVLKGPSAAALYGQRGASGAIIITTKKGNAGRGKVKVTLSSSYALQNIYGLPEFQNEYGQGANGQLNPVSTFSFGPRIGSSPNLSNGLLVNGAPVDYKAYPNNIRNFYETGTTFDNNININSGDKKQNVSFSVGNTNQKGMLPNTSLNRTNIGVNFTNAFSDRFTFSTSVNYINSKQVGILQGNGAQSALFQLFSVPRSFDLDFYRVHYKNPDGTSNWPLNNTRDNPYFAAYEDPLNSYLSRTIGNINLAYDLARWLNVSYRIGVDTYTDRRKRIIAVGSAAAGGLGRIIEDNFFRTEINGDLIVTAKKDNIFRDVNANLLVGQNINSRNYQNLTVQGDNLGIPGFYNVSNAGSFQSSGELTRKSRLVGYYSQLNLSYRNYLFLELTGRLDQTSTLAPGHNTYFYPSVATSWVFTDAFKIRSPVLSYGKLRASVATVGKDASPYQLSNVYSTWSYGNNVAQFTFPYATTLGFGASSRIANSNLTPEFTTSYEVGTNIGFFQNRLSIDAAYFYQSSKDQIVNVGIPVSTGYNTFTTNTGEMVNKGIELLVNGTIVRQRNFTWEVSANFTRIRNKVVSIGHGIKSFQIPGNQFTGNIASIVEGRPYGVILGNKWMRSPDGQLLINPATGTLLGTVAGQEIANPNRDFMAGLTNTIQFKSVSFSFLLDYKQGGDFVSWTASTYRSNGSLKVTGGDRETPRIFPGVIQTADGKYIPNNIQIPAQTYWNSMSSATTTGDLGVFDATTFRVRELSLSVDMAGSKMGTKAFSNARFTVFGRNLFYYAPNSPVDPELNTQGAGNLRGSELQSAPNARTIGASIRISF
ncbi:MAG: SusC/RagA family TonB-linked outer membrane protein [Flavisolibacter sp.]